MLMLFYIYLPLKSRELLLVTPETDQGKPTAMH